MSYERTDSYNPSRLTSKLTDSFTDIPHAQRRPSNVSFTSHFSSSDNDIPSRRQSYQSNHSHSLDRSSIDGSKIIGHRNQSRSLSELSENNWLSNLQRDLMIEADAVKESVSVVQEKLNEFQKFANDDRASTMEEFDKIANKIDNRKRKLAQSVATIMNTQDSMSNYHALPPLNDHSELVEQRLSLKKGLVRLEDQSIDPVIEEFRLRIQKLDQLKFKMGDVNPQVIEIMKREKHRKKIDNIRSKLAPTQEFSLYVFEEDEMKRIRAVDRWHRSQLFILAIVKLMLPIRRFKRSQRNWRKAVNVVSAASAFKKSGKVRAVRRFNSQGEEILVEESSSEEETEYDYEGNKLEKQKTLLKQARAKEKAAKAKAESQTYKTHDEKLKELSLKPGWKPPPDLDKKKEKFDKAQMARIRWRHAIGAAKCIARMKDDNNDSDDEDANYEFKFTETRTPVIDKNGDTKYVTISRTQLVNTETGQVKVLAASNFHSEEEKQQFQELKGAPAKPGVSNLLHLKKKPKKIRSGASMKLQNEQDLLIAQQQQLSAQLAQSALTSGAGFVTAAQYKEMEERKKAAAQAEAEEEMARLEEEEKNFSYHDASKEQGLSWEELNSSIGLRGRGKGEELGGEDENLEISPFDIAPEDPLRFGVWEIVRSPRFEMLVLIAILCNCVQLALYDPEVDGSASGVAIFAPPFTPYKIFEVIFMFLFPLEAALKLYVYQWVYFQDFWNKIDFFCVLLIFVNLVPGIPNLTVIRTLRMLKPLRSISRLPTLKVIVTTLVRSAQQIIDVYIICFFVFLVFAVLTMDMFGGVFAQRCLQLDEYCSTDPNVYLTEATCPTDWVVDATIQPDYLTFPHVQVSCGFSSCSEGYKCYLGNLVEYNPEGGALNFDNVAYALLTVFVVITRKGWVDILHRLWDSYGFVTPTIIMVILNMFGSYLLTQLVTAAITVTYEKVDDEMVMLITRNALLDKIKKENKESEENGEDGGDGTGGEETKEIELDEDGRPKKDPYAIPTKKKNSLLGVFTSPKASSSGSGSALTKQNSFFKTNPSSLSGLSGAGGGSGSNQPAGRETDQVPLLTSPSALPQAAVMTSGQVTPAFGMGGGGGGGLKGTIGGAPSLVMDDQGLDKVVLVSSPSPHQTQHDQPHRSKRDKQPMSIPTLIGGAPGVSISDAPPTHIHLGPKHWDNDNPTHMNAELQAMYAANPLMMQAFMPAQPSFLTTLEKRFCVKPKCLNWRGLIFLRALTRSSYFETFIVCVIFFNMYGMTYSDVQIDRCMFKYEGGINGRDDDVNIPGDDDADVTMIGDCIRGAAISESPDYIFYTKMNEYCSMFFAFEVVIKFLAEGFRYFDNSFNQFDTVVVLACLADIYYDLEGANAARFFRIINLVNKSTRVDSLKKIIVSIQNSLGPLSGVVILASIFLFVFAVGSIQLYGLNLSPSDRLHFRDFPHAMLTVFVLFTGDGWSTIMYKILYEEGPSNVLFFVVFVVYGMFGLSMLILATLISKFDCGEKDDFSLSNVLPFHAFVEEVKKRIDDFRTGGEKVKRKKEKELADLRRRGLIQEEEQTEEEKRLEEKRLKAEEEEKKKQAAKEKEEQKKKDLIVLTDRQKETTKAKNFYFVQADNTLLKEHPSVSLRLCAAETQEQVDKDVAPEELNGPIGYGYFMIQPDGMLHTYFLNKVVDRPWFENFIMFCIIFSCGMLAYEGPGLSENDPMSDYFALADNIFLLIFILECVLRILHKGFLFTNVAYLRDPWNQLDFFIVISNVLSAVFISVGGSFSNFRALRGFRALRPLRALKNAPELRTIVDVIANCLPVFINLIFCCVVFYGVAGILMMNMFSGRFWQCNDPAIKNAENCGGFFSAYDLEDYQDNTTVIDTNEFIPTDNIFWSKTFEPTKTIDGVPMVPREWYNAPRNFDSASSAMLTIFELSTLDHWVEILFLCMDSSEIPGETSNKLGKRWGYAFAVVFIIIIGNYLLMNLLVCGVVVVYDKMKTDGSRYDATLTRGQREFVDAIKLMLRTRPSYRQTKPDAFGMIGQMKLICYNIVMFDTGGGEQRGTSFELAISVLVVMNTLLLSLYYYNSPTREEFFRIDSDEYNQLQDTEWVARLDLIGDCLSVMFFVEMILKVVAFGPMKYWRDPWNRFDFIVVWSGITQNVIDGFMGFEVLPAQYTETSDGFITFDPKVLRILRVARLVRVVRLLKGLAKYDRIQSITQLVDTLSNCIKHIVNVFFLWLLVTVTFALMCMNLFGTIPVHATGVYPYGSYGEYSNFRTFPRTIVVLFQVATLDGWTRLMRDVMAGEQHLGNSPWAWAFFVIYLIVTAFLFLNIFTAIVMDQYDFTARVTSKPRANGVQRQIMTFNQASTISEEWSFMDPHKTDFIDEVKVRQLLSKVGPPIGFAPGSDRAKQLRHLRRMELRMTGMSRQVHYVDFFISCVLIRYRQQRKPISDIDIMKIRGKLALEIELAFPSIKDTRLDDTGGLISAVQACQFLQSQYRGLILRRMMAAGDKEGVLNHTENRQKQLEKQAENLLKEIEEANKAAKKQQGKDKKSKKSKKKKK